MSFGSGPFRRTNLRWLPLEIFGTVLTLMLLVSSESSLDPNYAPGSANESRSTGARTPASALAPATAPEPNGVTVIETDPSFSADSLRASGYTVIDYDRFVGENAWSDPSPVLRDHLFHEAGLDTYVKAMDHLERDFLFLRAQEQELKTLAAKYPKIPETRLSSLQNLISLSKRSGGRR